jgi:hypothetical protein
MFVVPSLHFQAILFFPLAFTEPGKEVLYKEAVPSGSHRLFTSCVGRGTNSCPQQATLFYIDSAHFGVVDNFGLVY